MKRLLCILFLASFFAPVFADQSEELVAYAQQYLGKPYKAGGDGPYSFDCSGFTKFVFSNFGYNLNRTSSTQLHNGTEVKKKNAQKGDLIFFKGSRVSSNSIGHVGIVISEKGETPIRFIHASISSGVCIDNLDAPYYNVRFVTVARVLSGDDSEVTDETDAEDSVAVVPQSETPVKTPANYRVKTGDTMYSIAKRFNCSLSELQSVNGMKNYNLKVGQILAIPEELPTSQDSVQEAVVVLDSVQVQEKQPVKDTVTHIVKRGETLYRISKYYDCTVEDIRSWNHIKDNIISVGQHLKIYK